MVVPRKARTKSRYDSGSELPGLGLYPQGPRFPGESDGGEKDITGGDRRMDSERAANRYKETNGNMILKKVPKALAPSSSGPPDGVVEISDSGVSTIWIVYHGIGHNVYDLMFTR
ncbi:hypothetical protein TWF718_008732 [Orbilia javanica]|uniref:Uncharacterized protein n=1 Tax=Orbilia javanica TaxID=47235 RepID=A0AAN8N0Y5_9PEZI